MVVANPGLGPGNECMEVAAPPAMKAAALRTNAGKGPDMALRAALFAALSVTDANRWGLARKNLILTLLEDRSCRLSALHAEVLLRWRLGSHDAALRDSTSGLQPVLLRAALAEDAASGGPVITASEPLTSLHMHAGPATPTNGEKPPATAWGECVMQLQVQHLAAQLQVPLPHPAGDLSMACMPGAGHNSEGALPSFLFEYESPTSQGPLCLEASSVPASRTTTAGDDELSPVGANGRDLRDSPNNSLPPVTPVLHRSSAPSSVNNTHSSSLFSPSSINLIPPSSEVPLEVATCWGGQGQGGMGAGGLGSPSYSGGGGPSYGASGPCYSQSYSGGGGGGPLMSTHSAPYGSRSMAGGPMPGDGGQDARQAAAGGPKRGPAGAAAGGSQPGGLRAAMAGCVAAPPATMGPAQQLSSPTMALPPLPPERRPSGCRDVPGLMWAHHANPSNGHLSALDSGLLSSDGMAGSLAGSSYGGSYHAGTPNWMNNGGMLSHPMLSDPRANGNGGSRNGGGNGGGVAQQLQASQAMPVGQRSPSSAQHPTNMMMMGLSASALNTNGNGNGEGMVSPLMSPACGSGGAGNSNLNLVAPRDSNESSCMPASTCSAMSDEGATNEGASSPGPPMDLESALEAIINFESPDGGAGMVSAATAAAAHNTLQQHVAAAVRAAAAGFRPGGGSANGSGAGGDGGAAGDAIGALGMSFAAVARLSADGGGPMGGGSSGLVGSAPSGTMTGFMGNPEGRASVHGAPPYSRVTMDASGIFMDPDQRDANEGHRPSAPGGTSVGMSVSSLSAPRPTGGWASVAARTPTASSKPLVAPNSAKAHQDAAAALLGSSAPVGVGGMHSPAMVAAARSMAAMQQQQQTAGMLNGRGLSALVAAAAVQQQQQGAVARAASGGLDLGGLPMLHGTSSGSLMGTRLWPRLPPKLRAEVQQLLAHLPGIKPEDLDDGVLCQLITAKRSDDDAMSALRALAATSDLNNSLQQLTGYMPHDGSSSPFSPGAGHGGGRNSGSLPTSSKAILQKLPSRVLGRLEEVVARCSYMDWKHFDAGVVKVMGQLSELSEADVLEELQLLEATDLSNVEYMPAYLNKRLNNRLWSRRKAQQQQQQAQQH